MKVFEIIYEPSLSEGWVSGGLSALGKVAVPFEKTKSISDVLPSAASKYAAMKSAAQANKMLKKIPFVGNFLYRSKIKDAGRNFELAKTRTAAVFANNIGVHITNLLVGLNIYDACSDYYAAATVVQESELTPEEKEKKLTELRGILFVQIIGGGLVARSAQLGRLITGILPAMAKLVPGTTIPKIGIAAREIINAGLRIQVGLWTTNLMTEQGIKALTDWLGETVVNGFGAGMNLFLDFLAWSWSWIKATAKYAMGQRASDQSTGTQPQQPGAAGTQPQQPGAAGTQSSNSGGSNMGDIAKGLLSGDDDFNTMAMKLAARRMGLDY